jgi:glycosyltransferase involved in cell wall biosynthesis
MKIFLVGTSFLPAYGGPAHSVSGLATALVSQGAQVGLWAPDGSAVTTPFIPAQSQVQRFTGTLVQALEHFGRADVIHDNGIWLPHNHQVAKLASERRIPRVVSTRGMLEPWSMNHKRWKKRIAWALYQRRDLQKAAVHHTTALPEAENVRRLNLGSPVCVIANGIHLPETAAQKSGTKESSASQCRTALFVGRLYPVKGLPMLVKAWARVRPAGWKMKIVGPDEAGHRAEIEVQIKNAGLESVFEFTGELAGEAKEQAFRNADLFILPTHSENFGIAIGEALAHGLPVITTQGAPWELLQTERCGWWTPVNTEGIAQALAEATSFAPEILREMGARGRKVVAERFAWSAVAKQFIQLYEWVARGGAKPQCVVER